MEDSGINTIEALLVGLIAILVIMWFKPGIRQMFEQSKNAKEKDWAGALIPVAVVVGFVILLMAMV